MQLASENENKKPPNPKLGSLIFKAKLVSSLEGRTAAFLCCLADSQPLGLRPGYCGGLSSFTQ